jgi:hypothetical protein
MFRVVQILSVIAPVEAARVCRSRRSKSADYIKDICHRSRIFSLGQRGKWPEMSSEESPFEDPPPNIRMRAEASGFSSNYQAGRDQYVYQQEQEPSFHLSQLPLSAPVVENKRLVAQPSSMLRTQFEIVPFRGRDTELFQLRKWRDTAVTSTAVCLIHGPGGQGKSRLAMHLARIWADEGWIPFQALSSNGFMGLDTVEVLPAKDAVGRLVLIDYAERREPGDLFALLRKIADPTGFPVRIIMLSRAAGWWWSASAHHPHGVTIAVLGLSI